MILYDSDGAAGTFTIFFFYNDNWIDAFRNVTGSTIFYSFYTKGYVIFATTPSFWDLSSSNQCFRFPKGAGADFKAHNCVDVPGKFILCEIVL